VDFTESFLDILTTEGSLRPIKHPQRTLLDFQKGAMRGVGEDINLGKYHLRGTYTIDRGRIYWVKKYCGGRYNHLVRYRGIIGDGVLFGTWRFRKSGGLVALFRRRADEVIGGPWPEVLWRKELEDMIRRQS